MCWKTSVSLPLISFRIRSCLVSKTSRRWTCEHQLQVQRLASKAQRHMDVRWWKGSPSWRIISQSWSRRDVLCPQLDGHLSLRRSTGLMFTFSQNWRDKRRKTEYTGHHTFRLENMEICREPKQNDQISLNSRLKIVSITFVPLWPYLKVDSIFKLHFMLIIYKYFYSALKMTQFSLMSLVSFTFQPSSQ